MKTIFKIGTYYVTKELAEELIDVEKQELIILESINDWENKEDAVEINAALAKLTKREKDLLRIKDFSFTNSKLKEKMSNIGLSIRAHNTLKSAELIELSVEEFFIKIKISDCMKFRNFGKNSLNELKVLAQEVGINWE